ncbi:CidA/LrgA family protein [Pseudoalteromonas sp. S2893]|uniref:CidA/LrgA family protein n=1 Tax=Pseudoalteromonas sp. S2893 TaxID=579530 RepID=UPI00110BAE0A|nr:CidA/LrgA family protein [Pseudoalteromonas sp. S2893]TMP19507.1 CidA/LrgA family protein [Pseudoalteromonas sp. S2893]
MKYLLSSAIILLCLGCAKLIMHLIDGSFPAPLLGMVILLSLLLLGVVKEHHIKPSASPILNIMPIFFIPAGVGFIEHIALIKLHWPYLVLVILLVPASTLLLVSSVVGYVKGKNSND